MLRRDELDALANRIISVYAGFHTTVLNSIARHLRDMNYEMAGWQVRRLLESGLFLSQIEAMIPSLSEKAATELRAILRDAQGMTLRFDDAIYEAAGLAALPLSPNMAEILTIGLNRTAGTMQNLVGTVAHASQKTFLAAADMAYMQIVTGAFSQQEAIGQAVNHAVSQGVNVVYAGGGREHVDSAMRKVVLTGVSKTAGDLQMQRAKEMGVAHVEVSAHIGARNLGTGPMNHESWQGRVYSLFGDQRYPDFVETTGYGTGEGLHGWNCRHSFYPFFEGISQAFYTDAARDALQLESTYNGKKLNEYQASQIQRYIERNIRESKRQLAARDVAGLPTSQDRLRGWDARMKSFLQQTGRYREPDREAIW